MTQRQKKDFLDEVIDFPRWNASEQNTVAHVGVALVEATERRAIPSASGANERVFLPRFGDRPGIHSLTSHAGGSKVNAVSHVQTIVSQCPVLVQDAGSG